MFAGDGLSSPPRPAWGTPKKKKLPNNDLRPYPSTPTPLTPRAIPIPSSPIPNRVSKSMIHPAQSPFTLWPGSAAPTTPWLGTAPSLGSPAYHLYTPISQQGPLDTEFIGAATAHDAEAADQGVDAPASGLKFGEDLTPAPKTRKTLAQLQMGRRSIATKRHHTSPFPEFKAKNNVFPIQPRTRAGMSRAKTLPAHLPVRVWTREIEDEPSPALALLWPVTPGTAILSSPTKLKTKTKPEDTRVAAQDSVGPASPLVRGNRLKFSKSMPVIKTPAKWSLKPVSGTPTFPSIKAKRSALTEDSESSGGAANKKTRVAPPPQQLPQGRL